MTNDMSEAVADNSFLKLGSYAQFAPGCIFGHVNGVLRICTRVQIMHMNEKCEFSIRFDRRF